MLTLIILLTLAAPLHADGDGLRMPAIYTDHMVLQRDRSLTIRGEARAGEAITVRIRGQERTAHADAQGHWAVTLDAMPADTGLTLRIASPTRTISYTDVAVGDVWLCSGQSNMAFPVSGIDPAERSCLRAFAQTRPAVRFYLMQPSRIPFAEVWGPAMLDSLNRLQYFLPARWQPCDERSVSSFSAIATAFARRLRASTDVPIGLILNAVDGAPLEAWIDPETLAKASPDMLRKQPTNALSHPWTRTRIALNLRRATSPDQRHPYQPAYLFDAGLRPLCGYPMRGVLWYQGESNAHDTAAYAHFFPLLVSGWRRHLGDPRMSFLFVQLSATEKPNWGPFRDMQRRLPGRIPACYMAISADRGDSLNIHYPHKLDVGERLARLALRYVLGYADVIAEGPSIERATLRGRTVTLHLRPADGLHTSDGLPPRTFELAGTDGRFHPAQAAIIRQGVCVYTPLVARPCHVRYAWPSFNRANLIGRADLPLSTFQLPVLPDPLAGIIPWAKD